MLVIILIMGVVLLIKDVLKKNTTLYCFGCANAVLCTLKRLDPIKKKDLPLWGTNPQTSKKYGKNLSPKGYGNNLFPIPGKGSLQVFSEYYPLRKDYRQVSLYPYTPYLFGVPDTYPEGVRDTTFYKGYEKSLPVPRKDTGYRGIGVQRTPKGYGYYPYTPIPRIFSGYGYYPVVSFLLPKSLKSFRNPLREKSRSTPYLFGILPRCIFSFTERSPGNPLRDFSVKEKIQQGSIPKRYGV